MKSLFFMLFIFGSSAMSCISAKEPDADVVTLRRIKRQDQADDYRQRLHDLRKNLNVYMFTSTDYPAIFAIIAGISTIMAIAVLFIAVGLWNIDPGKDSIIYRMTTTRMKKD